MTTLIFMAAIIGRGALSLRNAALVFILIFLINPFYIMSAGFQLSFAAIFGLLWFFKDNVYQKRNFLQRVKHAIYLMLMTTLIATLFTLPFIIAHFGFIPIYSLIGNLAILPIFSFAVMPVVILGTVLTLFGNFSFLNLSDKIYEFALNIAQHIANLPHANISVPHISNTVLLLAIMGMILLIFIINDKDSKNLFFKHANCFIGGAFVFVALIAFIVSPRPLFFAAPDHKLVGFVVDGKLKFNKSKSSKHYFAFNTWRKFNNEPESDKNERYKCTHGLCMYKTQKWNLAYLQDFTTVLENFDKICADTTMDYIITPFDLDAKNCNAKILNDGILIYPSGHTKIFSNHRPWHNPQIQNTDPTQVH
jgi:ComEC/Rec2-related protein